MINIQISLRKKVRMKSIDCIWHIGGFGNIDQKKCEWSVGCGRWSRLRNDWEARR